jgi:hypothetical protein
LLPTTLKTSCFHPCFVFFPTLFLHLCVCSNFSFLGE